MTPRRTACSAFTSSAPALGDIIAEAAVAIEFASSVEDLPRSIHAHPTLPEALKEAAAGGGQARDPHLIARVRFP